MKNINVTYRHIRCQDMTTEEIENAAKLFSENYGIWSDSMPNAQLRGKRVRYSPKKIIRDFVDKPDRYIIMALVDNELAGHIFYLKRKAKKTSTIIFVLQLVVAEKYRNNKIATRMMSSIWQQSNCYAWGLFTSNPKTIRVLEEVTMRNIDLKLINKRIDIIREITTDVFENTNWIDEYENGFVSTDFYVSHNKLSERIDSAYPDSEFPFEENLPEGKEWLAITFNSQPACFSSEREWENYLRYSQADIVTAYSNMKMDSQSWASHTKKEIDVLTDKVISEHDFILDFGCGRGRHTYELTERGYDVVGIDFSEKNIAEATRISGNDNYVCADIRNYRSARKGDVALCLYDVVGSFPSDKDNLNILRSICKSLKPNGKIVLSVMNMEHTKKRCKNLVDDVRENITTLLRLPSSNTMQNTGDVFDGRKILIEMKSGTVYRKEQFSPEDSLPCELIVRDRRYSLAGVQFLLNKAGFLVDESIYFQAGRMNKPLPSTDARAKEILVIAHKANWLHRLYLNALPWKKTW